MSNRTGQIGTGSTLAWRSVGQLEDTAEYRAWLEQEFPHGATGIAGKEEPEVTRRSFLKLMGASTALAGLGMAACRRPESHIVPHTKAPEWTIPGKAIYYATSMPRAGGATPLVVTSIDGRPTQVAPNHLHPDADGCDAFAHASLLDLYSPSRSHVPLKSGMPATRTDIDAVIASLATDKSAKIGFLLGLDDCPTRNRLCGELAGKFPAAKFYQYEALTGEAAAAHGDGVKWVADFSLADRILALDCDFAGTDPMGPVKGFFERRKPEGGGYTGAATPQSMNRLYAVEAAYTLTGGMADHRLRVAPSQVLTVAAEIARGIVSNTALVGKVAPPVDAGHRAWIRGVIDDLKGSAGKSLVLAGSRQPVALQHLAFAINLALGNIGTGKPLVAVQSKPRGMGTLATLKADIDAGDVESLILLTPANPLYDALPDLKFGESFAKLKSSVHLGHRCDATARGSDWHIPAAHFLESWSDTRSVRGTYTMVQPMILPLYPNAVSELELLLALLSEDGKLVTGEGAKGEPSPACQAVRETFGSIAGNDDESWTKLLRDGFYQKSCYPVVMPKLATTAEADITAAIVAAPTPQALEIIFATDYSIHDGRWIDNGWLQEAPDPVTKLTWDNAALVAPLTAKALGIYELILSPEPVTRVLGIEGSYARSHPDGEGCERKSPLIRVDVNGCSLVIPVLIAFGQAENTLVIPLGYGQGFDRDDELKRGPLNAGNVGLVGVNRGFNGYPLRSAKSPYFATGAKVVRSGGSYSIAVTQEHSAMYGRALAREISTLDDEDAGSFDEQLAKVKTQGDDAHAPPDISLYQPKGSATWHPDKDGKAPGFLSDTIHQWGMAIDLSRCMGCTACLVACQAENNIPIVGKSQVARGREMHWIRMDRYFASQSDNDFDAGNPALVPQPVACAQCEMAPCESVCPANATVHTEDGLNAMAYNRCVGTRYCANNCPYKARRFNFFDYNKRDPLIAGNLYKGPLGVTRTGEATHLLRNPNVTVRMRGVMEKCTYCVQRLQAAVIRQKRGHANEVLESGQPSTGVKVSDETLRIPVDSVRTACQDACPAGAITFGNLLDGDKSALVRAHNLERSYALLNSIGTRPRTRYLARVKNPNPKMPDAKFIGKATIHSA